MDMKSCATFSLIYLGPAYILYLYFIIHLFFKKDKEFKTPFFNIIKLMGIIDLIFIPIHYYSYRIGSFEVFWPFLRNFTEKNISMTIVVYLYCVFQHAQFWAHFLLSLNRLSAVTMMNSFNTFWSSKKFPKYAATVILLPAIYMSWLLYFGGYMPYEDGYYYEVDSLKTTSFWLKKSTFCVIIGCFTCALSFIMDLITFIYICTKPLIDAKTHFRLLAISTTVLITHIVYMFFTVFWIFPAVTIMDEMTYFIVLVYTLDLQSLISPICNIALNPYLRNSFFRKSSSHVTIIHSIHSNHSSHIAVLSPSRLH